MLGSSFHLVWEAAPGRFLASLAPQIIKEPVTLMQIAPTILQLLNLNPFTHLAIAYQEVLFKPGPFTQVTRVLAVGAASVFVFLFAYFVFDRLRDTFAEEV